MKKKITLKEFFDSEEKLCIHCDTEEKANILLRAFDRIGKKWCNNHSYLEDNDYGTYKNNTCYCNGRGYAPLDFYAREGYTIYEFEEVDLRVDNDDEFVKIPFLKDSIKIPLSTLAFLRLDIEGVYPNKDKKLIVVKFDDNTTIKVQCQKEDNFDVYVGVALAICYHKCGSKNQFRKSIDKVTHWQVSKKKNKVKKAKEDSK